MTFNYYSRNIINYVQFHSKHIITIIISIVHYWIEICNSFYCLYRCTNGIIV